MTFTCEMFHPNSEQRIIVYSIAQYTLISDAVVCDLLDNFKRIMGFCSENKLENIKFCII